MVYSGGLTHNADMEPVLDAAAQLRGLPIRFAIVGDGVQKQALVERAAAARLDNVQFYPFQPIERYGEVLAAADVTLVTLNSAATLASVPSKIYKQMAAARPIVAITNPGNELSRLVMDAQCGVTVAAGDLVRLAAVLADALDRRADFAAMGQRGREYLKRNCSRKACVGRIETALMDACGEVRSTALAGVPARQAMFESLTAKKLSLDEMSKVAADGFEQCMRALVQMGAPDVTIHECGEREFEEQR